MIKQRISIAAVFIIGCVAGGVSARVVAPPAHAGTTPPKWEHWCTRVSSQDDATRTFASVGDQGWELVTTTVMPYRDVMFCFKRPR